MLKRLLSLGLLLWSVPACAQGPQVPPDQLPVPGRFCVIGYDKTLSLTGDIASVTGRPLTAMNNGFVGCYPSTNVQLDIDHGEWIATLWIWTGSSYVQTGPHHWPIDEAVYYPEVPGDQPDLHAWVTGTMSTAQLFPVGYMTVIGYDGSLCIHGDLSGCHADDGLLFIRPVTSPHLVSGAGGAVWHMLLNIDVDPNAQGNFQNVWAVYPRSHVLMQETP